MHKPQQWSNLPKFFTAQDFDVTTTLLYLLTGAWVRLQVRVVKGDLCEQERVRIQMRRVILPFISGLVVDIRVVQISHLAGFTQKVHRVLGFEEGCHCESVVEGQITICVSLRLNTRSAAWSVCDFEMKTLETTQHITTTVNFSQSQIIINVTKQLHAFGFLTGISSLTVLAWTSTSLNAYLESKNLLSILSGARKPGEEKTN